VPAPRVAVVATLEPVLATVLAWIVHGEALAAPQVAGGVLVLAAVAWVQAHAPAELESAPAWVQRSSTASGVSVTRR
jgi:drug/metabolite transporter (DMT)-like permease